MACRQVAVASSGLIPRLLLIKATRVVKERRTRYRAAAGECDDLHARARADERAAAAERAAAEARSLNLGEL